MAAKKRTGSRAPGDAAEGADEQLSLTAPLTVVARSLAMIALRLAPSRPTNDAERIRFLGRLGLDRHAIAKLMRTTKETVSSRLAEDKPVRRTSKAKLTSRRTPKRRGKKG